LGFFLLFI